jgi:hypothetical protein
MMSGGQIGDKVRLLLKEYGPNGEKAAFEMVRTGTQGGQYAVLKSIAKQMINDYAGTGIRARISHYWTSLCRPTISRNR